MKKGFELNDYRVMDNKELVNILTNTAATVNRLYESDIVYGEEMTFDDILSQMTPSKRNIVMAGVELYKRCNSKKKEKPILKCSTDVFDYMKPIMGDNRVEECWAIFVNQASRVIKRIRISSGGYASTQVDIRVIVKEALLCDSTAFFICHNHPSGREKPSVTDDRLTQSLTVAAKTLNLTVLDHLIICNDKYYSYTDEGKL